jgi:Rieske Fe-S protein
MTPQATSCPAGNSPQTRRAFCTSLCAVLAAAALRGEAPLPAPPGGSPDPGPLKLTEVTRAEVTPGKVFDFRKLGAFYLAADEKGVFALTAVCTHRGCLVLSEGPTGYGCPCHDSAYDFQGGVTEGPAKLPLRHLAVTAVGPRGQLQVDTSTTVPPGTRL